MPIPYLFAPDPYIVCLMIALDFVVLKKQKGCGHHNPHPLSQTLQPPLTANQLRLELLPSRALIPHWSNQSYKK